MQNLFFTQNTSCVFLDSLCFQRFACGQILESVNIPYNQAFLEEGGLAPSTAANTVISFKGRVIVVVGNRNNYPAKVGKRLLQCTAKYIICFYTIPSFVTFYWHNGCVCEALCEQQPHKFINQSAFLVLTNHSSLRSYTPAFVWHGKQFLFRSVVLTYFRFLEVGNQRKIIR